MTFTHARTACPRIGFDEKSSFSGSCCPNINDDDGVAVDDVNVDDFDDDSIDDDSIDDDGVIVFVFVVLLLLLPS